MTRAHVLFGATSLAIICIIGCSKDAPSQPNYGDPALVVEGTEVWQAVGWGGRGQFDGSDEDGDGQINPGEFTASMRREAFAQRGLKVFQILDTDGDGQLVWEEYRQRPGEATIVSLDVDGNGTLSVDELAAMRQFLVKINRLRPLFIAWDRDGDGELVSEELENRPFELEFFDRDRDGDELMSHNERIAGAASDRTARSRDFRYRDRDISGMLSMREFWYRPQDAKYWAMDANGDAGVTKQELEASSCGQQFDDPGEVFASLDRNSDGRIGVGEFRERSPVFPEVFGLAAEPKVGSPPIMFGLLDRNEDGVVVIDEVTPLSSDSNDSTDSRWQKVFDATDANKNQRVEYEEFRTRGSRYFFVVVDENRDGNVSKEEFRVAVLPWMTEGRIQEIFAVADTDGNGVFNADEFEQRAGQTLFLTEDLDEDQRITREEYAQNKSSLLIAGTFGAVFDTHDLDGSGDLSRREFDGVKRVSEFASLDSNGDGRLSVGEYFSPARTKKDRAWRARQYNELNSDHDQMLSRREFLGDTDFAIFWELDENGDDVVTLSEFKSSKRFARLAAVAEPAFRVFDLDRNGALEVNEYEMRTDGARLTELDRDGDALLALEEFADLYSGPYYAYKAFASADKDSDDFLSAAEFGERPDQESLRSPAGAVPRVEWAFGFLDSNKDGKVAHEEFLSDARKAAVGSVLGQLFDSADRDHDELLTLSEFAGRQGELEFFSFDEDGSGMLSVEEYYAKVPWASKNRVAAIAAALDEDGNDAIQYSEFRRHWDLARFLLEDQNEDGEVVFEEFYAVRAHHKARDLTSREFAAYDRDKNRVLTPTEVAMPPYPLPFYERDANGDMCLLLEEFVGGGVSDKVRQDRLRSFRRLDRNGDGRMTVREYCFGRTNAKYWGMDRDGDMEVSVEEFVAARHADTLSRPAAAFRALDLNQDGMFCIAEYRSRPNDVPAMFGILPELGPTDPTAMFAGLDLDGDGFVVASEVVKEGVEGMARFGKELAAMDQDGDGKVTPDEFRKRSTPFDFPAWDSDRNGSLSAVELRPTEFYWATDSYAAALAKAIDADGDGSVSYPELSGRSRRAPFLMADWDEDGTISIEEYACQNQHHCDRGQLKLVFETRDSDGDGRLSRQEFTEQPDAIRFITRDANSDGVVDAEEFCAGTKSAKEKAAREKDFKTKDRDENGKLAVREFLDGKQNQPFWDADENGDNALSRKELAAFPGYAHQGDELAQCLDAMDRNADGAISLTEFQTRSPELRFREFDRDGDAKLSLEEFADAGYSKPRFTLKAFEISDSNSDKTLTADEFAQRASNKAMAEAPWNQGPLAKRAFQRLDADGDGKIVRDEFITKERESRMGKALPKLFQVSDRDGDGGVTFEELNRSQEPLRFLLLDDDNNAVLTASEYAQSAEWASLKRVGDLVSTLDTNGSGDLQYDEYRKQWGVARFLLEDRDENGSVVYEEFHRVRQHNRTPESTAREFAAYDRDGDEILSREEISEPPYELAFLEKDTDVDGLITLEEFLAKAGTEKDRENLSRDFRRLDRNADGQVTVRDYFFTQTSAKYWGMDRDGDMKVSEEEFLTAKHVQTLPDPAAAFQALDRDHDGLLCIAEYRNRPNDMPSVFGVKAESRPGMFAQLDLDRNGAVVADEVAKEGVESMAKFRKQLVAMDKDGDEKVTLAEFTKRSVPFDFPAWDTNCDGSLSLPELRMSQIYWATDSHVAAVFEAIDTDGDGGVSLPEFSAREGRVPLMLADWDEDGTISIEEFASQRLHYCDRGQLKLVFDTRDSDGDGVLSREEFTKNPDSLRFINQDVNGDGSVDKTEFFSGTKSSQEKAAREKDFETKDRDEDGELAMREFLNAKEDQPFWDADENGDNALSREELAAIPGYSHQGDDVAPRFDAMDQNADAAIGLAEFQTRSPELRFREFDRDGDALLTFEEFADVYSGPYYAYKAFASADKDSDDLLSAAEFGERPEEESLRSPAGAVPRVEWTFGFLDSNKDGKVAHEEFLSDARKAAVGSVLGQLFDSADRDHDELLTLSEFAGRQGELEFFSFDEDGSGMLSVEEYYAKVPWASKNRAAAITAALDEDGNDAIQYSEFRRQWHLARFLLEDQDEDGKVVFEEFHAVRAHHKTRDVTSREFAAYDRDKNRVLTPAETATPAYPLPFYERDVNGDMCVLLEEFVGSGVTDKVRQNRSRDFGRLDRNGDGRMTVREYCYSQTNAKYWGMDRDGDMKVSEEEFLTAKHAQTLPDPAAAFQALDRDHDGLLCIAEYKNRPNDMPSVFGDKTEPWPGDSSAIFARLDLDGDGAVVPDEVAKKGVESMAWFRKHLVAIDKDGDEKVTLAEFTKRSVPFDFPAWDTNRDGSLSLSEFRMSQIYWATDSHVAAVFKAIDSDGDGGVSLPEFSAREIRVPLMLADWDEDGMVSMEEYACRNQHLCDRGQLTLVFETRDRDGDGMLSGEEFTKNPDSLRFIHRDVNGDGAVDKAEFCSGAKSPEEKTAREKDFEAKDRDENGTLTQQEFFVAPAQRAFWKADQDEDNVLSREELGMVAPYADLGEGIDRMFGELDLNKNGALSLDEFQLPPEKASPPETDNAEK